MDDEQILANLAKEFHELVSNEEELHTSVESFFDNLIDETTLGIIFDEHRKFKTGVHECLSNENDADAAEVTEVDIFNQPRDQKELHQYCDCPNCERSVAAEKFTQHLASCMGIGRSRPSRRRTSGDSSKGEASGISTRPGPGKPRDNEDLTASVKREKQKRRSMSLDMNSSSGHKRKRKPYKKRSKKSSTGINLDIDTKLGNFDQCNVEKMQQYYICPKCDYEVHVEKYTSHLESCMTGSSGPNRKESGSTSRSQEYYTFLCQGPSRLEHFKDLISGSEYEEENQYSKIEDVTATSSEPEFRQESPNNLWSAGISVDTDTIVDSFDQLDNQTIQQYCCICPKCDCAVDVETFASHVSSCMIERCEPNREESGSTSRSQEYDTSLCQGLSEHKTVRNLISSSQREEETQYSKYKDDAVMSPEHKQGKEMQYKEFSQESPNNLSFTDINIDTDSMVDSFNQLNVQKTQQYFICHICNDIVVVEKFTSHLTSCIVGRCAPKREDSGGTSKIQEGNTFLCQESGKTENAMGLISSSQHEEEKQYGESQDTGMTLGHQQVEEKDLQKSSYESDLSDMEIDVVGDCELPSLLASAGANENNSVTPSFADSVPISGSGRKSRRNQGRKKKKRARYSHSPTCDSTNLKVYNQPKEANKKRLKKSSHKSPINLTDNEVAVVAEEDSPFFFSSVDENSLTPDVTDSKSNSCQRKKSDRKKN